MTIAFRLFDRPEPFPSDVTGPEDPQHEVVYVKAVRLGNKKALAFAEQQFEFTLGTPYLG